MIYLDPFSKLGLKRSLPIGFAAGSKVQGASYLSLLALQRFGQSSDSKLEATGTMTHPADSRERAKEWIRLLQFLLPTRWDRLRVLPLASKTLYSRFDIIFSPGPYSFHSYGCRSLAEKL